MAYKNTQEYIQNYIDFYSSLEVKGRGKQLFKNKKVTLREFNEEKDKWEFFVEGTRMYRVNILKVEAWDIQTSCNCPFDWGGICKHTVAALLHIADLSANNKPEPTKELVSNPEKSKKNKLTQRGTLGYELPEFEIISEKLVRENTNPSLFNQLKYNNVYASVLSVNIEPNTVVFELDMDFIVSKVTFEHQNGKLFVSSSAKTKTKQLSKIEAVCLLKIANSNTPMLFSQIFNGKHEAERKSIMSNYGLDPNSEFKQYFQFSFNETDGLFVRTSDNMGELVPVNDESEQIERIVNDISELVLPLSSVSVGNHEERELGFVLTLKPERSSYFRNEVQFDLMAITGKPNKAKTSLSSHLQEYDEDFNEYLIDISDNARELLSLIQNKEQYNTPEKSFYLQKRVMELLTKEKHVYARSASYYKLRKSELKSIEVSDKLIDFSYEVKEDDNFVMIDPKLKIDEDFIDVNQLENKSSNCFIHQINRVYYTIKDYRVAKLIANHSKQLKMVKSHKKLFLKKVIQPLSQNIDIHFNNGVFDIETIELDFNKKQVYLSEEEGNLIITPQVEYHQSVSVPIYTNGNVLVDQEDKMIQYIRNFELEDELAGLIATLHPKFEAQKSDKIFHLNYADFTHNMWFYRFFDILQENHIEVYGLKDLKNFKYSPHKGKITTSISSEQDWFEVNVNVSFGDNEVKLSDIRKAIIKKQKFIQLKDGSVGVLPTEWLQKLEKYFRHGEVKDDTLTVSKLKFSIVDELFDKIDDAEVLEELSEKRKKLATFSQISDVAVPKEITAELRPYQKEGFNWLNFLHEMSWGGILADDMGLGKTLQVLTFIQNVIAENKLTNLIVVPTTLLFNWQNEIKKFAPNLKALYHYGTGRAIDTNEFKNYDLVFTTYGVLLRDIEMFSQYQFNYAILDESQAIKNPASRRYKAVNLIKANNRVAMTGTPIENNTFDLFAQMNFVNRGFFGGISAFKDQFSNLIDKGGDENIAAELQRLINPFILRRTKEKVATELPSKTEDVIYCDMGTNQRKVYDAYRNKYRDQLLNQIEEEGVGKSKIMVLQALTHLRQICDSPALLNDDGIDETESVKIQEIVQHITDKTGNHKILIFSQFVKMLSLLKQELTKRNIDFEYLDGKCSSQQREHSVSMFQEKDDLRVFLISLKAGGTGLNLTAADYVYILDPWWNPAVENQAIDRCYRIGQDKNVFAYRMICKNTVEEKILKLQEKKKKLAGDIIQTDENIMKAINADDIKELFS
ncbi:MAG: SNF2-related protein [Marinifilum sp.]|jgi:SNF2 family DNA or RNA helicase|nr:SNF2-related protein [Marinifilum sp.]